MNYQIGTTGRVVIARFDHGDDVLRGLQEIAAQETIKAGYFHLVGALSGGRFVVGPETEDFPPVPAWRELQESHEVVGFGTILWEGETPKIHVHGAFGKGDSVKVGCLREDSEVFIVIEAVITEIVGVQAVRQPDPATGMSLISV